MADSGSCQVCEKIMRGFHSKLMRGFEWNEIPDCEKKGNYINLGALSDIIEIPCPHADWVLRVWESIHEDNTAAPRRWSAGIMFYHLANIQFYLDGKRRSERQFSLVSRPDKPGHAGTARVLDPQWSDPSILRAWYSACQEEHGKDCQEQAVVRSRQETIAMPQWLVDVVDQCIVPCDSNISRYIALSYTWGGVECLKHTKGNLERLKERGSLHPDGSSGIPRTVRDAMGITRLLGERYLWVDSLCIDQDGNTASKDLNSMHHIYHNSVVCLVAWAGTDAYHGLRGIQGISEPRPIKQMFLDIADGERLSCLNVPRGHGSQHQLGAAEGSHYNQRGWTFQEYMFARRRLIFTDGPLHWVCGGGCWAEDSHSRLEGLSFNDALAWILRTMGAVPDLRGLTAPMHAFNTRYFTYEADTVTSFLGMQNHLGYSFLGGLNHGHPEMFFDISLAWKCERGSELTRRTGLAADSVRGYSPPTWSWMGWRGEVSFPRDEEYAPDGLDFKDGFTHSVAQWFTMNSPLASASNLRPVNCRWNDCKTAVERDPTQIPTGWQKVTEGSEDRYKRVPRDQGDFVGNMGWAYRYPVPLPPSTSANEPIEQRPLLFARTTRAYFTAKDLQTTEADPLGRRAVFVELICRSGERAGILELHRASDAHKFKTSEVVELVAVVKGWTREFSKYLVAFQEQEDRIGWEGSSFDDDAGSERAERMYSTGSDMGSEREERRYSTGSDMGSEREERRYSTGSDIGPEREESRLSTGAETGSEREESRYSIGGDTGSEKESRLSTGSELGSERDSDESRYSIGGDAGSQREESRWSTGSDIGSEREESRWSTGAEMGSEREESRHSCYFVLCVEWQSGVARRVASGKIEAEVWEQHQEPVDLILG